MKEDTYLTHVFRHRWSRQIMTTADESHSAGWKLRKFIHLHRDLSAPVMSTDMSQVDIALFPSF